MIVFLRRKTGRREKYFIETLFNLLKEQRKIGKLLNKLINYNQAKPLFFSCLNKSFQIHSKKNISVGLMSTNKLHKNQ